MIKMYTPGKYWIQNSVPQSNYYFPFSLKLLRGSVKVREVLDEHIDI